MSPDTTRPGHAQLMRWNERGVAASGRPRAQMRNVTTGTAVGDGEASLVGYVQRTPKKEQVFCKKWTAPQWSHM